MSGAAGAGRRALWEKKRGCCASNGVPAQPHEIGDVAAFLLSDDAARVTGQVLAVDGGAGVR